MNAQGDLDADAMVNAQLASTLSPQRDVQIKRPQSSVGHHNQGSGKNERLRNWDARDFWQPHRSVKAP